MTTSWKLRRRGTEILADARYRRSIISSFRPSAIAWNSTTGSRIFLPCFLLHGEEFVASERWNAVNRRISRREKVLVEKEEGTNEARAARVGKPDVAGNNLLHPTTCCTPLKILHASPSNFTVNCLFGKKISSRGVSHWREAGTVQELVAKEHCL